MKYACSECTGRSRGTVRPPATSARPATRPPHTPRRRPAEHALPPVVGAAPAEDVQFDLLQVEQVQHLAQSVAHGWSDAVLMPGTLLSSRPRQRAAALSRTTPIPRHRTGPA